MPHIAGKKISGSHSTVIQAAVVVVETARKLDCVSKVALGIIKPIRGNSTTSSLKLTEIDAGLRVKVRGPNSVQELFIYTANPAQVREVLEKVYPKSVDSC